VLVPALSIHSIDAKGSEEANRGQEGGVRAARAPNGATSLVRKSFERAPLRNGQRNRPTNRVGGERSLTLTTKDQIHLHRVNLDLAEAYHPSLTTFRSPRNTSMPTIAAPR